MGGEESEVAKFLCPQNCVMEDYNNNKIKFKQKLFFKKKQEISCKMTQALLGFGQ